MIKITKAAFSAIEKAVFPLKKRPKDVSILPFLPQTASLVNIPKWGLGYFDFFLILGTYFSSLVLFSVQWMSKKQRIGIAISTFCDYHHFIFHQNLDYNKFWISIW